MHFKNNGETLCINIKITKCFAIIFIKFQRLTNSMIENIAITDLVFMAQALWRAENTKIIEYQFKSNGFQWYSQK